MNDTHHREDEHHEGRDSHHYPGPIPPYSPPPRLAGWTISDVQSIIMIGVMAIGGVAWGIKLDSRTSDNSLAISDIRHRLDKGVLPLTEQKLEVLDRRLEAIEATLTWLQRREIDRASQAKQGGEPK